MKVTKRLLAALLSMAMLLAMAVPAFAEGETTGYTISVKSGDTHTYSVYQILTGDLSEGTLSNVKAGQNYNSTKGDAAKAAEDIAALKVTGQELANKVAEYVSMGEGTTPYATVSASSSKTGVPAGYYLIKDNGATDMTGDSYSTFIVKVVKDVTIESKKQVPSFEKKVKDIDDSTETSYTHWQDAADHDIGDQVPFQLKGTVASNYDSYTTYYFAFHDVEEKGLTFNSSSVKVYVDGTQITSGYEVKTSGISDGCTFEVVFSDLKTISSVHAGSVITVEYTSELNQNAVLGEQGNVNKAKLEYSNNPNNSQGGENDDHGNTPWDNVIVFTYKVVVNKVDANNDALKGAAFKLEKEIKATTEGGENTWKEVGSFTAGDATSFTFSGLDDGNYRLTETTTPAGYNTIDPITFTVTATHEIEWTTGNRTDVLKSLENGDKNTGAAQMTPSKSEGSLTTTVVNKKGAELPSTGGIGTTIFYVVGGCMMFGAAVLLITKKRMENN